jgi:hypothetical protein
MVDKSIFKACMCASLSAPSANPEIYKGDKKLFLSNQTLAIVGARKCSNYTQEALQYLFPSFKEKNITIISGLAEGADSEAHIQALKIDLAIGENGGYSEITNPFSSIFFLNETKFLG